MNAQKYVEALCRQAYLKGRLAGLLEERAAWKKRLLSEKETNEFLDALFRKGLAP